MDATTSYFLKKYYPHVIKWWLVEYNPEFIRVWPSETEKEDALRLEAIEQHDDEQPADEEEKDPNLHAYNETTGSYSGLYGQKPVDADTQLALDSIMNLSAQSNQKNIDNLLSDDKFIGIHTMSEEQKSVIEEANAIYERLQREAAEDAAHKIEEIQHALEDSES
jgi:hypothetical protein